jgi:transcriptional regulator with XRE-family HTH domain
VKTDLGQLIKQARTDLGLRLEDVADQVGVTAGALSHIESGRRLPQPYNAVAIADVLGIPRETILALLDDEHSTRRRSAATSGAPSQPSSAGPEPMRAGKEPRMRAMPIEALFEPAPAARMPAGFTDGFDAGFEPDFDADRVTTRPARLAAPSPRGAKPPIDDARTSREAARWSRDTKERLRALEDLADGAARAIRTLRGLLHDDDPNIAREAERLLRELDVRSSE